MRDYFGNTDPKKMPGHYFSGAIFIDYATAVRADAAKQDCTICPRHWYIDAVFRCRGCGLEFTWTAAEQRTWFERYRFWVDSEPRHCSKCRAKRRHLANLRKEYDAAVATARDHGSVEQKQRIVVIVNELESALGRLPEKMISTRDLLLRQIQKQNKPA